MLFAPKHATAPRFLAEQYPDDLYHIGVGIAVNKNYDRAREEARIKAKVDLISLLSSSTMRMNRTLLLTDNGRKQRTVFEETINESFIQEIEGVLFIEEPYNSRRKEQTTRAILSKTAWEAQKLTKIEQERVQARALLSERHPEMPAPKEIVILELVAEQLGQGVWGSFVEDRFDDAYGNALSLARARLNQLYAQALQSTRVY